MKPETKEKSRFKKDKRYTILVVLRYAKVILGEFFLSNQDMIKLIENKQTKKEIYILSSQFLQGNAEKQKKRKLREYFISGGRACWTVCKVII